MIGPTIHDAIRAVYTNATTIYGNDVNSVTVFDNENNNVVIDATTVTNAFTTLQSNFQVAQNQEASIKQSALSKLTALGLTQQEITSIIS